MTRLAFHAGVGMRENSLLKHRSRHVSNNDYPQWKYNSYDLRWMIHFAGVSALSDSENK